MKPLWTPTLASACTTLHVALGLLLGSVAMNIHWPWYYAVEAGAVFVALKEGVFDVLVEQDPFIWSGLKDGCGYFAGLCLWFAVQSYMGAL